MFDNTSGVGEDLGMMEEGIFDIHLGRVLSLSLLVYVQR
jgi:hypothetical protein